MTGAEIVRSHANLHDHERQRRRHQRQSTTRRRRVDRLRRFVLPLLCVLSVVDGSTSPPRRAPEPPLRLPLRATSGTHAHTVSYVLDNVHLGYGAAERRISLGLDTFAACTSVSECDVHHDESDAQSWSGSTLFSAMGAQCVDLSGNSTFEWVYPTPACPIFSGRHCRVGRDWFTFGEGEFVSRPVNLCVSSEDAHADEDMVGRLGLNYKYERDGSAAFETLVDMFPDDWPRMFSLDLNPPELPSFLDVGGYVGEPVVWSDAQTTEYPYTIQFSLYHLSVCGANVFDESSHWPAWVDVASPCLRLPYVFFERVHEWTHALTCSEYKCQLAQGYVASDLPTISFRLSETGPAMHVPLESLVEDDVSQTVCLERVHVEEYGVIYIGSLVMRSLYMAVDQTTTRVGFRQKGDLSDEDAETSGACVPRAVCASGQSYAEANNQCVGPPCERYFLESLDEDTGRCVVRPALKVVIVSLLLLFVLLELVRYEVYRHIVDRVLGDSDVPLARSFRGDAVATDDGGESESVGGSASVRWRP